MTEKFTIAEQLITDSLDRAQKCLDKIFDPEKDKVDHTAVLSLICHFNTAVLLEALRRHDPTEADRITQWLEDIHEAGDTAGELVWQWRDQIAKGHKLTGFGLAGDEPAPPADAMHFQLHARDDSGTLEVLAVRTSVPGLLIVQALTGGAELGGFEALSGAWSIAHEPSARLIATAHYPLDTAKKVVERLGAVGVDWSRTPQELTELNDDGPAAAMRDAFTEFDDCRYCTDADHVPVAPWRTAPDAEAELVTVGDGGES